MALKVKAVVERLLKFSNNPNDPGVYRYVMKAGLISTRRIIFTPSIDLKDELASTAIQITCIDRNGKEVKRVTSTSGEVEDPENENQNQNNNGGSTPVHQVMFQAREIKR